MLLKSESFYKAFPGAKNLVATLSTHTQLRASCTDYDTSNISSFNLVNFVIANLLSQGTEFHQENFIYWQTVITADLQSLVLYGFINPKGLRFLKIIEDQISLICHRVIHSQWMQFVRLHELRLRMYTPTFGIASSWSPLTRVNFRLPNMWSVVNEEVEDIT